MANHRTKNPVNIMAGNPTEKIFKLGAARVTNPKPTLTNNKVIMTGNETKTDPTKTMELQEIILPIKSWLNMVLPMGKY